MLIIFTVLYQTSPIWIYLITGSLCCLMAFVQFRFPHTLYLVSTNLTSFSMSFLVCFWGIFDPLNFVNSCCTTWSEVKLFSCVWLFATPWTVAYQAPPSLGFSRQEYWSGLPFPFPGDLPNPVIEPGSPVLQADALLSEPPGN